MKHAIYALCLPLALAACNADAPTPRIYCPNVRVLEQTSSLTQFLPGRQDAGAQITSAHITGVAGACALDGKSVLHVTFQAGFSATNGPANHGKTLTLPYFVALEDRDDIISKSIDTITIPFNGNTQSASATSQTLSVDVRNIGETEHAEILVGFQLTPDQLAYAASHPAP